MSSAGVVRDPMEAGRVSGRRGRNEGRARRSGRAWVGRWGRPAKEAGRWAASGVASRGARCDRVLKGETHYAQRCEGLSGYPARQSVRRFERSPNGEGPRHVVDGGGLRIAHDLVELERVVAVESRGLGHAPVPFGASPVLTAVELLEKLRKPPVVLGLVDFVATRDVAHSSEATTGGTRSSLDRWYLSWYLRGYVPGTRSRALRGRFRCLRVAGTVAQKAVER